MCQFVNGERDAHALMVICSLSPRDARGKNDPKQFDTNAVLARWLEGSKRGRYLDAAFNDLVF